MLWRVSLGVLRPRPAPEPRHRSQGDVACVGVVICPEAGGAVAPHSRATAIVLSVEPVSGITIWSTRPRTLVLAVEKAKARLGIEAGGGDAKLVANK